MFWRFTHRVKITKYQQTPTRLLTTCIIITARMRGTGYIPFLTWLT